ncbi:hypothetical protein FGRA07_06460 [Fusarium graminearum]|nr:hypothetical protein FGRA07_06460 [Fusarium graminearum]
MGLYISPGWRQLDVAIIGGGVGGMSAAIALRRAGHRVSIYERASFVSEAGASLSCAANGTRWLKEWEVELERGDGVVLRKLISRDWTTGKVLSLYELDDYEDRWGYVYYMFQRQRMHDMLKHSALGEGAGEPAKLWVDHKCERIDMDTGLIQFENGRTVKHDLIVGADGIGSTVRGILDIWPKRQPADSSCLHANVLTKDAVAEGLVDFSKDQALQFWGGQGELWDKIVLSPCQGGKLISYYFFFPRDKGDYIQHSWGGENRPVEELLAPFPTLDPQVRAHLALGKDIQPWRLWKHEPYPYITKDIVCLVGDAAHPMMPHQSQAACMAIEDAAALGILFSKRHFNGDVAESIAMYQDVRLPRATKVQAAAARASENINERIGFSSNVNAPVYKVKGEQEKLTIEEMNAYDMHMHIEELACNKAGQPFTYKSFFGQLTTSQYVSSDFALAFLAIGFSSVLIYQLAHNYRRLQHIPGPLVAKLTDIHRFMLVRSGFIHLYQASAHERYGSVVRFGPNLVSICDPEAIQEVFNMRNGFNKSNMYRAFRPWTPAGLLVSVFTAKDDIVNRQMKQHIAVYFSLSYTAASFEERVDNAIRIFFKQLDSQFVTTGAKIDLTRWFKFFSYDAMGLMTFSRPYGCLENSSDAAGIISDVKNSMLAIGPQMTQMPWLDWLLHKNGLINMIKPEPVSALLKYVLARISERRNSPKAMHSTVTDGPDANGDFLGYFLQAQEKKSNKVPPQFLSTWTLANILGGSDSTASMLRSVVCFLVENPDALETMRAELRDKKQHAEGSSAPIPKWTKIQDLPFLNACVIESLRLDPPFATTLERVVPPEGVTICGAFYPGGTVVGMNPYITNRHRPTWGEDADQWRPSRWLEGDPAHIRKLQASLLSFGAGTRGCLGQHVAVFEIKKLVVALFMNYNINLVNPRSKDNFYSWVIMPSTIEATVEPCETT